MRRFILAMSLAAFLAAPSARADEVGIDLHLRFGDPAPPPVHIVEPPVFLYPPGLGFYVAVGVPYDCFFIDGRYYLYTRGRWFIADHYGGPWYFIDHRHLPPGLARHSYRSIVKHREAEYRAYRKNRGGYGGRVFHPGPLGRGDRPGRHGKGRGRGR